MALAPANEGRRVLVVGGAGYVGAVLVRRLLAAGYSVSVLDALLYGNAHSLAELSLHPRFRMIEGDMCNPGALSRALADATDVVLLAALVGDPICRKYPELARHVNLDGTIKAIQTLSKFPIDRLVFTSTCSNYGLMVGDQPATETSPLKPQSLYAETKVAVEHFIADHYSSMTAAPTVLRLSTAFGLSARMRFDLTVSQFTRTLARGETLVVYDEDTWRPYCHLEDIAQAVLLVLEAPRESVRGEIFNVGVDSQNYTKRMFVELIRRFTDKGTIEYKAGGTDSRNYRVSFEKIKEQLGFSARVTVEEAVVELIEAVTSGRFQDVETNSAYYGNYIVPEEMLGSGGAATGAV